MNATQDAASVEMHGSDVHTDSLVHAANAYASARINPAAGTARWQACDALATAGLTLATVLRRLS